MTKKIPTRKKRNEYIYGTTAGNISELTFTIDQLTGAISFGHPMVNTYSEVSYDRPKGPKVLSRVPQPGRKLTFDGNKAFEKNFTYRCAVDTNNRKIAEKNISITAVVTIDLIMIPGARKLESFWKFDVPFCFEWTELKVEPEKFGWLAAYERLIKVGLTTHAAKIGMIVDSDLGNIKHYNQRTQPLVGQVFLPPNVTLVYATSDSGKESALNKALSVADSIATQCLDAISKAAPPHRTPSNHPYYESVRLVTPNVITHI